MNTQRLVVLGLALFAAGGSPKVEATPAPVIPMSEVLVASSNLTPGQAMTADRVRWQKWPTASVDPSFITHDAVGSEEAAVKGTVVRMPIMQGQPINHSAIVHGDASGFMAATLGEGMRAISIVISAEA